MSYIPNLWSQPAAYVVRHGETELNAANCFRGWENPSLNEAGRKAAESIAQYFSYEKIGRVVTSDLDRAQETAEYILNSGSVVLPYVSADFNLRPWNIAEFAGAEKTPATLKKLGYYIERPDLQIPDGESLTDFQNRQDALLRYIAAPYEGLPTVVVTHTSNLTFLAEQIDRENNIDSSRDPETHDVVEPGGVVAIYLDTNGKMHLEIKMGAVAQEAEPEAS